MRERPAPRCCRHEPPYPDHTTVVFALLAPDLTAHHATERCGIEAPHRIEDCGEFDAAAP